MDIEQAAQIWNDQQFAHHYEGEPHVFQCVICERICREEDLGEPHACAKEMGADGDCCESCVDEWLEEFWEYVEEWDDEHINNGETDERASTQRT